MALVAASGGSAKRFFCRELRAYAREHLKLKPSRTAYMSWVKGGRQPLRFSKYSPPRVEELFSTHYIDPALVAAKKAQRAQATTAPPSPLLGQ